jgi:hypothetical protein
MNMLLIKSSFIFMNQNHTVRNVLVVMLALVVGGLVGFFIARGEASQTASLYNIGATKTIAVAPTGTTDPCGISGSGSPCNPEGLTTSGGSFKSMSPAECDRAGGNQIWSSWTDSNGDTWYHYEGCFFPALHVSNPANLVQTLSSNGASNTATISTANSSTKAFLSSGGVVSPSDMSEATCKNSKGGTPIYNPDTGDYVGCFFKPNLTFPTNTNQAR